MQETTWVLSKSMHYADSCFFVRERFELCIVESQLLASAIDVASDDCVFFACEFPNEFITIFVEDWIDVVMQFFLMKMRVILEDFLRLFIFLRAKSTVLLLNLSEFLGEIFFLWVRMNFFLKET